MRDYDLDHDSGWTSTDITAGRSRAMGEHPFPTSAEAQSSNQEKCA
jgi:hypothetical protein